MATINIRRDVTDPFYRYKMERLQSKIEGKGNGIKSVIVNLSSVAHSLSRDPAYVVKFFGFELGAQVTANPTDDRYIINGAHDAGKLQDYLDTFISKFVLCKKCKNPETDLIVQKDGTILRDCKACGQRTDVDARHKLSSFITKNPPKREKKAKGSKKSGKKNGDAENGNSPKDSGSEDINGEADGGSDDELTRLKDDDWAVDMSEEAIKARAQNLPDDLKRSLVIEGDDDEAAGCDNPFDQLGSWIVAQKAENSGEVDDVEIYKKAQALGIELNHRTLQVLAQTLFDENIIKKNQVKVHAGLLKKMITSERHEKAFLGGTERFVGNDHPQLISAIPTILMAYYENDLASEDTITKWGSRASQKYVDVPTSRKVRKAAEPFLTWLQEADEDGSDDDEDDDE
ncbi:domain found in IF2B/IF5-domain-containing protein [Tuber borchii]|uniref:Domain found in IF2B/IF5-domain-containing protein n=1 Tax=Tuber borchii TaxID=42251 RepID=A0A2T6ZQ35_TUBBO|nr:domain found in IF2B/IF5-domain-containing protein [Tuber borchii]